MLCCVVLCCVVLCCIVLYCIVLYCIVLYCIVLYCIVLYCIVLYCIVCCRDDAMLQSGNPITKTSREMENHVFTRAQSKVRCDHRYK